MLVKIKAIVVMLLLIFGTSTVITGIGLIKTPRGRAIRDFGWTFFGMTRWDLEYYHTISGVFFTILCIIHLLLNWRVFLNEIRLLVKEGENKG